MSIEEHLKTAQLYLNEASKLYEEVYRADVNEKLWAAVKHATIALTTRFLGVSEPKGTHGGSLLERLSRKQVSAGMRPHTRHPTSWMLEGACMGIASTASTMRSQSTSL